MKRAVSFSLVLVLTLLTYSCFDSDSSTKESEHELSDSNIIVPPDTLFYQLEKTYVTGDFDGDGIIDTLFERNISQLTGEEIVRIPMKPGGDFYDDVDFMNQQKSKLFMSWNKTNRDTLH